MPSVSQHPRLAYLDNLKVVLVAGVIAVHVAITYGMHGSWYLQSYDRVAPPVRDAITALGGVGWLFGLGLFFLVSGWLSAPSLERKGAGRFMRERLVRLGLPLVAYTLLVGPVLEYVSVRSDGRSPGLWPFVSDAIWGLDPGPTWFLEALLVFSAALALWWALRPRTAEPPAATGPRGLRGAGIFAVAAAIAVASFAVRLAFPLGSDQFHLQLSVFPQYAILFGFGALAGQRGWLEDISPRFTRRCGLAALAAVLILPAILAAGGFFAGSKHAFAGGWHWQALAAAAVEGALAVSACVWLIAAFRRRFDRRGSLARRLGDAAYGAFLLHPPVIVGFAVAVHPLAIASGLKLAIVLVAGISASFGLASAVTRLRPLARVIGAARAPRPSRGQPSSDGGLAPAIGWPARGARRVVPAANRQDRLWPVTSARRSRR